MSARESDAIALGEGIFEYPNRSSIPHKYEEGGLVFLDHLVLPCRLPALNSRQISIINRFRERHFGDESIGSRAKTSREMFSDIANHVKPSSILEIGCGKFPIKSSLPQANYLGVDIDQEAVAHCIELGINVETNDKFLNSSCDERVQGFDLVISAFAFHFRVSDEMLGVISSSLDQKNGILCFNFISNDSGDVFHKLAFLCRCGLRVRIIKSNSFSKREFLACAAFNCNHLDLAIFDKIEGQQ